MGEKEWSEWSYDSKVASGQFLDGPGWIKKLTLAADPWNLASVSFYDGHSTNGTLITQQTAHLKLRCRLYRVALKRLTMRYLSK